MTSGDSDGELERLFPQAALDALPQPIWVYGHDGVVAGCNAAAERFWRLPRAYTVGKFDAFAHAETPAGEPVRGLMRAVREVLREGTTHVLEPLLIDLEVVDEMRPYTRARAYIENTVYPLRDAAGAPRYAIVLQRDVTELVEKREAVEQALARIAAQDELITALEAAQHAIVEQQRTIAELSTPILQVWPGVLTLPVIGALDEARAGEMMHKLLEQIVADRAEFAILDLTGVHAVDVATAGHLARIVGAVTLLGARGIVSGVSPAVAEALAGIDVDMSRIETCRDLSDALMRTLQARGRRRQAR